MVGPSKILTVSYGTFSCTLEGFDEPFTTMKAIAEYFRDLAAEDRYFGAEPPTPDAEMLHRIAEREIKRRVEAKIQDNGVILRPQIEAAEDEDVAPTPPVDQAQRAAGAAVDAAIAAAPAMAAVAPAIAPAIARVEDADDGAALSGISAKLQRIRAAVAQVRAFDAAEDEDDTAAAQSRHAVEAERLAEEEAARVEAERLAEEEAARVEAERLAAEQAARAAEEAPAEHPETPRRRVVVVRPMSPAPAAAPAADDDAVLQAALAAARETTPPPLPVEALAPVVEPATDAADTVRAAMAAFAATETAELGDEEDETPVIAAASSEHRKPTALAMCSGSISMWIAPHLRMFSGSRWPASIRALIAGVIV